MRRVTGSYIVDIWHVTNYANVRIRFSVTDIKSCFIVPCHITLETTTLCDVTSEKRTFGYRRIVKLQISL